MYSHSNSDTASMVALATIAAAKVDGSITNSHTHSGAQTNGVTTRAVFMEANGVSTQSIVVSNSLRGSSLHTTF